MRILVAAAVPEGAVVRLPYGNTFDEFKITRIENSTPVAGKITWYTDTLQSMVVPASLRVDVKELP